MKQPNPIDLLNSLVSIPSVSRDEAKIACFLHDWLASAGVKVRRMGDNVVAVVEGAKKGPVFLLNSHLDTVSAKDGWLSDPWQPFIEEGQLIGLGAGDAKASVSAMACATAQIASAGLERGTLIFAATRCEEVSDPGLEEILPELGHIDAALVGEPTGLDGAVSQGGLLLLEGRAVGRTAHAARSHMGVNALTIAARDILELDGLSLEKIHPFLGASCANVTILQGGERHNVIPDSCGYTIDIRYTPSYDPSELIEIISAATQAEISVRSDRLQPVETDSEAPVVKALQSLRPSTKLFGSSTMSDWVFLRGVDAIKIGPGQSERSHTPNEGVAVAEVEAAVDVYAGCVRSVLEA
jgi:acetylornithine deacetylase